MKKIIFITVLCLFSLSSNSQILFDFNNNKTIGFGLGHLCVGGTNYTGLTCNTSILGIYFDICVGSSLEENIHSMSVNSHMIAGELKSWHIGYKVPVFKWLYVYPFIGKASLSTGYCDGSNYNFNGQGTVYNHYYPTHIYYDCFDYGFGVDLQYIFVDFIGANVGITFENYTYNIKFEIVYNLVPTSK